MLGSVQLLLLELLAMAVPMFVIIRCWKWQFVDECIDAVADVWIELCDMYDSF